MLTGKPLVPEEKATDDGAMPSLVSHVWESYYASLVPQI